MLLYIVRHGDPDYKADCLTPRGRLQAEAVGKRLSVSGIDRIFSSPMGRAKETAEPTARLLGLDINIEDWSHEIKGERLTPFPDGEKKSVSVIQNTYYRRNGNIALDFDRAFECDGFSQSEMDKAYKFIEENGRDFLERLGYREEDGIYKILQPNEEKVALFCHTVMGRLLLSYLLHIPVHLMWSGFQMTHSGVTVIEFKNNPDGFTAPKCRCFSDMSHLFAEGLDMTHDNDVEV
ncbi:MAG: histidine phosphatase family protein [Clostridia bacterium]|nr:histidine phosphatase family protein [Clostridia bacterium]